MKILDGRCICSNTRSVYVGYSERNTCMHLYKICTSICYVWKAFACKLNYDKGFGLLKLLLIIKFYHISFYEYKTTFLCVLDQFVPSPIYLLYPSLIGLVKQQKFLGLKAILSDLLKVLFILQSILYQVYCFDYLQPYTLVKILNYIQCYWD